MNGEVSMKKKALLAVLLAMTLLLTSCALIKKDEAVDAATVILKMGDKEITKKEVQQAADNVLYEKYQYYSMFGSTLDMNDPAEIKSAQQTAVDALKKDMVTRAKVAELGLESQLTEEDNAKIRENADSSWDYAKSYVKSYYLSDEQKALEGEALDNAVAVKLEELGVNYDDYLASAKDTLLDNKLKELTIKDITVSDDEVKADYDSKVAADEEKYKENLESWATADRNGTSTLYYTPAGIRRVKQILIKFKADDQAAIDEANGRITDANKRITEAQATLDNADASDDDKQKAEADKSAAETDLAAAQADLKASTDKAFANLDEETDAVLEALNADPGSWDKLAEEKNEDPGMKAGAVNAEKGYAVFSGMTSFDSAFVDAAMSLAEAGAVSGKIRGETYGYYIIKYVGEEAEGAVALDSVKDAIHSSLLTTKQNDFYNETLNKWVSDAGIKENLGALND